MQEQTIICENRTSKGLSHSLYSIDLEKAAPATAIIPLRVRFSLTLSF